MEDIKNALANLETAVLKLETAVHQSKKTQTQTIEKVGELKDVVRTTYERLDKALTSFRQEGE